MKGVVAAALATAFLGLGQTGSDQWLVERGRVGPVSIGASAHTVYEQFRDDRVKLVDLRYEGMLSPALELKRFGQTAAPSLIAELAVMRNQLVVYRIQVVDAAIRTKEGIGIGSTFADLRSRYQVDSVGSGEGNVFARVETLGTSFQLDTTGTVPLWSIRDTSKVPGTVRIVSMLVTQ
jgi:hypothetical protein